MYRNLILIPVIHVGLYRTNSAEQKPLHLAAALAATTLLRSQSYLGAQYRRLRARLGAPKAITAMAHKLARLVYRMLKWGHEYVDKGLQYYEERHREQQVQLLKKRAAKLGLQIIEPEAA
jgi:transposase